MGAEFATGLGMIAQIGGGVANTFATLQSGRSAAKAYAQEARMTELQGQIAGEEARRDAAKKKREVGLFREMQASKYNSSGVLLQGSPLLVLEETRQLGLEEVDAILKRGDSMVNLYQMKSQQLRNQGRAAMSSAKFSAIAGGFNTMLNMGRLMTASSAGGRTAALSGRSMAYGFSGSQSVFSDPTDTMGLRY